MVTAGELTEFASGLQFPEGPIALDDGSLLVVEIARGTLSRITPGGAIQIIAQLGGGPNGAALGPDGRCYLCNNGGVAFQQGKGRYIPVGPAPDHAGGWIEAVDLTTGKAERLYDTCDGHRLVAPNDIVFDATGGFWFTDLGTTHGRDRRSDPGALYYAAADGSSISQAIFPLDGPNGVGLSPDGTGLYVAESNTGRLWAFGVEAPGKLKNYAGMPPWKRGNLLWTPGYYAMFDSLAVDDEGFIYVADIPYGGLSVVSPQGVLVEQIATGDELTTNICFGAVQRDTIFITLSSTGRIAFGKSKRKGLRLHWTA
ncbi:SMP-30/gluconolactonase/LRE family protein [Sphingobium phenoxybenzoativorans]|uniref:SMP-30/gluconolactonase/LRE family protein n=1 Tax=Sphingobium phenoxybenzoativorans TaxID=1592790 RepID=A0A975Q2M8_9SPHN|nr:SMP-30/gluconolactonase/LRE family protein [Sphingobium phenoxybenzoativorans]QUT06851.1 SMP-30/gluconolactonase/LRE family protein [Sphingobium phenoxybenzoativorans]